MTRSRYHLLSMSAARELIWSQRVRGGGRIFAIAFQRLTGRRDGSAKAGDLEVVYCRFNVKKHLKALVGQWEHPDGQIWPWWAPGAKPASAAYDRADHNCCCVWVTGRKAAGGEKVTGERGYRSIRFDTVRWLKLDGVVYKVGQAPPKQH